MLIPQNKKKQKEKLYMMIMVMFVNILFYKLKGCA